jgi:hypothetical protein
MPRPRCRPYWCHSRIRSRHDGLRRVGCVGGDAGRERDVKAEGDQDSSHPVIFNKALIRGRLVLTIRRTRIRLVRNHWMATIHTRIKCIEIKLVVKDDLCQDIGGDVCGV